MTVFENDPIGWAAAAGSTTLIDFEVPVLADASFVVPAGDEYIGLPGGPVFLPTPSGLANIHSTLAIINPGPGLYGNNFIPISGANVFAPDPDANQNAPEGIVRVTFAVPIVSFSAWFLDVEGDFASTGLDLTPTDSLVDIAFSGAQGDDSQAFLGFVTDTPTPFIDIYFSTELLGSDGMGLDDIRYGLGPVPEPTTIVLFGLGLLGVAALRLRRSE